MNHVIILNGPPLSGKDTLGAILKRDFPQVVVLTSFKHDLIKDTAEYFDVDLQWFRVACENRNLKEVKTYKLDWKSPREALQHVSENIRKPAHGQDYYGIKAKERIEELFSGWVKDNFIIFTDGGFMEEAAVIGKAYKTTIVQLRDRGTFKGDTRGYITHESCTNLKLHLTEGEEESDADILAELICLR